MKHIMWIEPVYGFYEHLSNGLERMLFLIITTPHNHQYTPSWGSYEHVACIGYLFIQTFVIANVIFYRYTC